MYFIIFIFYNYSSHILVYRKEETYCFLQFNYAYAIYNSFYVANIELENIVVLEESLMTSHRMRSCYLIVSEFNLTEPFQNSNNIFRFKCKL